MQTTSPRFRQLQAGHMRPLSWQFKASFDKTLDDSVTFFTLDTSVLDGSDILASADENVLAEWDKYIYTDYSDRVIQLEYQRELQSPYSVNLAIADIKLNNYDGFFTRGQSPLDPNILPRRPVRISAGFGGENLPQFVGLSDSVPKVDYPSRTADIHCEDFLSFLFSRPLDQTVIYQNVKTDELLDNLFQLLGLTSGQYVLDEGFNTIPFVYFEKGTTFGDAIKQIMQAELGSLYMGEMGIIRFSNRVNISSSPVHTFDKSNIIDYSLSSEDKLINVVDIKAAVREVQPTQIVFTGENTELLQGTNEVFFNFTDPVTSIEPVTGYVANSSSDGTGSDVTADITVTDTDLFSTSVKVTFDNSSGGIAYLKNISINGTPAKVVRNISLRTQDDESVEQFEEHVYSIENNLIQSNDGAISLALSLLNFYKDYASTIELDVKGSHAFQLGDTIQVTIDEIDQTYSITKLQNVISSKFAQKITATVFNIPSFFILDQSILDGSDTLSI